MDYEKMTKKELVEALKEKEHLASAVKAKDEEINRLKEAKNQLIEKKDVALKELEERLADKNQTEYIELKTRTDAELKKTKDALAESQTKLYELDKLRIEQLNEVLYAYGDLLKIMQGTVDTHLKLNTLVVKNIGGK
jgi:CRISPR/Cas system-associated protein Cas10 (large subunit of type III CRISPR-Cas system)